MITNKKKEKKRKKREREKRKKGIKKFSVKTVEVTGIYLTMVNTIETYINNKYNEII